MTTQRLAALTTLAQDFCGTDMINIDPLQSDAEISEGDDGIWVRAWVLLPNDVLAGAGIVNSQAGADSCEDCGGPAKGAARIADGDRLVCQECYDALPEKSKEH